MSFIFIPQEENMYLHYIFAKKAICIHQPLRAPTNPNHVELKFFFSKLASYTYIHRAYMRRSSKHTRSFQDHHCIVQVSSRGDLRHQDPADGASGRSKKKTQDQVQGRSTTTDAAIREDDGDELLLPARSCARRPTGTSSVTRSNRRRRELW
jgi:hypothetical protein